MGKRYCKIQLSRRTSDDYQESRKQKVNQVDLYEIEDIQNTQVEIAGNNVENIELQDYPNEKGVYLFYLTKDKPDKYKDAESFKGIFVSQGTINTTTYSIYKKEDLDTITQFAPVAVKTSSGYLMDYNVSNGRNYVYVAFPVTDSDSVEEQDIYVYGNVDVDGNPTAVRTHWDEYSIAELVPMTLPVSSPTIKKAYTVDQSNIWLFKYDFNGGEQTQNLKITEHETLGQYTRISHGRRNNISGSVSCYLGSEIICVAPPATNPFEKKAAQPTYTERLNIGRFVNGNSPLSDKYKITTNEAMDMLDAWRKFAYSKNLKLLTDKKGQVKIVQILSTSATVADNIHGHPVKISFTWTEVGNTNNTTITGDVITSESEN